MQPFRSYKIYQNHEIFLSKAIGISYNNQKGRIKIKSDFQKISGDENMTEVVAALIWDKNRLMICQRPKEKARGLFWEFVGGKVEPGETKPQALIRECREELAITVFVGEQFMETTHSYPDMTIHLTLFFCTIKEGTPKLIEHHDLRWITPDEITDFSFCPADQPILKRIMEENKK